MDATDANAQGDAGLLMGRQDYGLLRWRDYAAGDAIAVGHGHADLAA